MNDSELQMYIGLFLISFRVRKRERKKSNVNVKYICLWLHETTKIIRGLHGSVEYDYVEENTHKTIPTQVREHLIPVK